VTNYKGVEKGLTDFDKAHGNAQSNEGERYKNSKKKNKGRKVTVSITIGDLTFIISSFFHAKILRYEEIFGLAHGKNSLIYAQSQGIFPTTP